MLAPSLTFTKAGTYSYVCLVHPQDGRRVVRSPEPLPHPCLPVVDWVARVGMFPLRFEQGPKGSWTVVRRRGLT